MKRTLTLIIMATFCGHVFSQTVITDGGSDATTNYITKWEDGGLKKIKNSLLFDNGTYVGINTNSPANGIHLFGTSLNQASQIIERQENSAYGGNFVFRSRKATWGAIGSGIFIGSIGFQGPKTTLNSFGTGAVIQAVTTEAWTDAANGTKLAFMTTSNGSTLYSTRMTIDQSGNVGIGLNNPTEKLQVDGSISWGTGSYISTLRVDQGASIELRGSGTPYIDFSGPGIQDYDVRIIRSGSDMLSIDGGGLQINSGGNLNLISGNLQLNNGDIELTSIGTKLIFAPTNTFVYNTNSVGHQSLGWYDDSWNTLGKTMYLSGWAGLKFFTGGTPRLFIDNSGNVGIGITPSSTVKLTVDGKIECEEVEVKNIGADFVFEDGYKLMTIAEVEKYINENKHLPGIPAASETEKGIGLGQMSELLLQKIEEMQLYIIDLQKQIDELKK